MRENVILQIVIPVDNSEDNAYNGLGRIKKVQLVKKDPMLSVTLQIDIVNPLDRNLRQKVP